jgi:Flp pilus assembly protein TadG
MLRGCPTRRSQRAQSMVEFAIVVPLFLLLLFAVIDFTRLLSTYASLVNGGRELTRAAAISSRGWGDAASAFTNLTVFGGGTTATTSAITLSPDTGSASCTLSATGCTFNLGATCTTDGVCSTTLNLTAASAGATASSGATISTSGGYLAPRALGIDATATGDLIVLSALVVTGHDVVTGGTIQICNLPLQSTCATHLAGAGQGGGFVEADVIYHFKFNPLFQNRLAGITDVWFMRPFSILTTTARTYLE